MLEKNENESERRKERELSEKWKDIPSVERSLLQGDLLKLRLLMDQASNLSDWTSYDEDDTSEGASSPEQAAEARESQRLLITASENLRAELDEKFGKDLISAAISKLSRRLEQEKIVIPNVHL